MSEKSPITARPHIPQALRAIREHRGFALSTVGTQTEIDPDLIVSFEEGQEAPSSDELKRLANAYSVSYLNLLRGKLDLAKETLIDFRTLSNSPAKISSDGLDKVTLFRRAVELLSSRVRRFTEFPLYKEFSLSDDPREVAAEIQKIFPINREIQRQAARPISLYGYLRAMFEVNGVPIYQDRANISDFRGLVISKRDEYSAVFINGGDLSDGAKAFTLIHELAHLCIGETGLSDPYSFETGDIEERYCNQVAAEFLAPPDIILNAHKLAQKSIDFPVPHIESITRRTGISQYMAAIRLVELGLAPSNFVNSWKRDANAKWGTLPDFRNFGRTPKGSVQRYNRAVNKIGIAFTLALHEGVKEGKLSELHIREYFGVNPEYLDGMLIEARERINLMRSAQG